jgi:RpiB/LacA/LacB family sugar-phosphate isomerase
MLYIAADHGGYQLKKHLVTYLKTQLKIAVKDLGPETYDKEDDFPDYAIKLGREVVKNEDNRGIMICRTGVGPCMAINKIKGGKAFTGSSIALAENGRRHHNANVICLGADFLTPEHADAIVRTFLETKFDGADRQKRRIAKIEALEK